MLSDRRNLHLVNLDLVFLGQVLQEKTLTCFDKPSLCAVGAQHLNAVLSDLVETMLYFRRG